MGHQQPQKFLLTEATVEVLRKIASEKGREESFEKWVEDFVVLVIPFEEDPADNLDPRIGSDDPALYKTICSAQTHRSE